MEMMKVISVNGYISYESREGYTMKRDSESNIWILRNPLGVVIDKNPYRNDLAEAYGFKLEYKEDKP